MADVQTITWAKEVVWNIAKKLADGADSPPNEHLEAAIRLLNQAYSELERAYVERALS